jgi:hypothetical protein
MDSKSEKKYLHGVFSVSSREVRGGWRLMNAIGGRSATFLSPTHNMLIERPLSALGAELRIQEGMFTTEVAQCRDDGRQTSNGVSLL